MEFVDIDKHGHVAIITINRPEALNALNTKVLEDIDSAFKSIDVNEIRAVIVTGKGDKSFVAGADIAEMLNMTEREGFEFSKRGNAVFRRIEAFPIPVIAAVNGFALGGGNELAMSCDIRLASENAMFGQPEVSLGITPGFGGTQRFVRLIGSVSKAKELLFTAKNIDAAEAFRLGLVSSIHKQEDLMNEAMKIAERIARNAPIAVRNTKHAVNEGAHMYLDEAINLEAHDFGKCFNSEDQKEGMTAFLERRKEKNFKNK